MRSTQTHHSPFQEVKKVVQKSTKNLPISDEVPKSLDKPIA